jgi:transcriptional regulator with XRE-family HTH domain
MQEVKWLAGRCIWLKRTAFLRKILDFDCSCGFTTRLNRMMTVGERIKARRDELAWTQDDLANKAGISKSFLSDLENGKRNVGADKLLDIARALSLSLDYLMTGKNAAKKETPELKAEVQIPTALADFAAEEGISFRQAIALLEMQNQIIAHRSSTKKGTLEKVDWQKFYEAVKEFL